MGSIPLTILRCIWVWYTRVCYSPSCLFRQGEIFSGTSLLSSFKKTIAQPQKILWDANQKLARSNQASRWSRDAWFERVRFVRANKRPLLSQMANSSRQLPYTNRMCAHMVKSTRSRWSFRYAFMWWTINTLCISSGLKHKTHSGHVLVLKRKSLVYIFFAFVNAPSRSSIMSFTSSRPTASRNRVSVMPSS